MQSYDHGAAARAALTLLLDNTPATGNPSPAYWWHRAIPELKRVWPPGFLHRLWKYKVKLNVT
jgi:hypothetical protein